MRRICALILTLTVFLCALPHVGASPVERITLGLDEDGTGQYRDAAVEPVRVSLNGAVLDCDVPAFIRNGRTMVPVRAISEALGASVQWFDQSNEVTISWNNRTVQLKIGSAQALVNGEPVELYDGVPAMVANYNGTERTMLPLRFVSEYLGAWVTWDQQNGTAAIFTFAPAERTVVLDAGHGGNQSGAVYGGIYEKDINLAVTGRVAEILRGYGVQVVMTRNSDLEVGLYTRADIANAAQADIFLSIHSNALDDRPDVAGILTFYYPTSECGARLAQAIQTPLCSQTGALDRGISGEDFVVLRETQMCAALVEMGFMTNEQELELLISPDYQDKLAAGIAQGIINYLSTT